MLGSKIKQAREEKGMTQAQLAKLLGISATAVVRYENNTRRPNIEMLKKISEVLDKPIEFFIDDSEHSHDKSEDTQEIRSVFSERLRYLRVMRGLQQKDVADALGLNPATYGMYERGEREPSLEVLYKLAEFFEIPMDFLFGRIPLECFDDINFRKIEPKYLWLFSWLVSKNVEPEEIMMALRFIREIKEFNKCKE